MPFEHIIDHALGLVVVKGNGEGSVEETADSARRLLNDQSIGKKYVFMFLVDDIALNPVPEQMSGIAFLLETMLSKFSGRMAIVTSVVGRVTTANLISTVADRGRGRLRTFTLESRAREWLLQSTPK
jgi:hypothetical protein